MKTVFIYYTAKVGKILLNGGHYVTLDVSKIVNNHPIHIGTIKYDTSTFRGEHTEVMNCLIDAGEIGIENRGLHYFNSNSSDIFEIIKI